MKVLYGFRKLAVFLITLAALFIAAHFKYDGIFQYLVILAGVYITGNAVSNFSIGAGKK